MLEIQGKKKKKTAMNTKGNFIQNYKTGWVI